MAKTYEEVALELNPLCSRFFEMDTEEKAEEAKAEAEELKKELYIEYVKCKTSDDKKKLELTFDVKAKNLKTGTATIFVNSIFVYPMQIYFIETNGQTRITLPIPQNMITPFSKYTATVLCDGRAADSKEFVLNCAPEPDSTTPNCYCDRDFTVEEVKNIVKLLRDNTYDKKSKLSISRYHSDKLFYKESLLPVQEQNNYVKFTESLNKAFSDFEINTCIRKINFLAQCYVETMYFTDLSENNPSSDLGDYYGRGLIHLTHKGKNDSRTGNAYGYLGYKNYSGLDVITTPDLICKSLETAAHSSGWFWRYGKLLTDGNVKDLNTLADTDDVNEIIRLVTGGQPAKSQRLDAHTELKKIFKYEEECINKI